MTDRARAEEIVAHAEAGDAIDMRMLKKEIMSALTEQRERDAKVAEGIYSVRTIGHPPGCIHCPQCERDLSYRQEQIATAIREGI